MGHVVDAFDLVHGQRAWPDELMSPRRTLNNWGNSSMLNLRSHLPRGDAGIFGDFEHGPVISFMAASSCLTCSAFVPWSGIYRL